jgi:hypothetical protein
MKIYNHYRLYLINFFPTTQKSDIHHRLNLEILLCLIRSQYCKVDIAILAMAEIIIIKQKTN